MQTLQGCIKCEYVQKFSNQQEGILCGAKIRVECTTKVFRRFGNTVQQWLSPLGSLKCVIKSSESFGSSCGNRYPSRDLAHFSPNAATS
jgi:hypothetical protein